MTLHGRIEPHGIRYYPDLMQGTDEWLEARRGILTASEMKLILTPTFKAANNDKTRAHVYELLAQRVSGFVEPSYISDDMLRGHEDEVWARVAYSENIAPVEDMGFITNDKWGFRIGYSPDGLVGDDGLIECKSRRQKYQVQTICEASVPPEYMIQLQTGMLVSERDWIDFISYCGGLPMFVLRVWPDDAIQAAIIEAAAEFEAKVQALGFEYHATLQSPDIRTFPTERRIEQEMFA